MRSRLPWMLVGAVSSLLASAALAAGPVTVGAKGGMVFSDISPRDSGPAAELERKYGPSLGGFASWRLNEFFAIQGEALYVSKGFSYGESEATDDAGNLLGTFETLGVVDYAEIPILLHVSPPLQGALRPGVLVGPAVSFKLRERQKTTGAVEGSDQTDFFKDTDFGVAVGADVRFPTGPGWSLIEVRYTHGLVDAADDFRGRKTRNRALMVMAGVAY